MFNKFEIRYYLSSRSYSTNVENSNTKNYEVSDFFLFCMINDNICKKNIFIKNLYSYFNINKAINNVNKYGQKMILKMYR